MDYLTLQNRRNEGDAISDADFVSAEGKHVIIIGGGDTGADCLGTAHRQGAKSVHQLELLPQPPQTRAADNPWPEWPHVFRVSSAHEEGGERLYQVSTQRFSGDANGRVKALHAVNGRAAAAGRPHRVRAGGRQRVRDSRRPGAPGDGLHRAGEGPRCSTSWA